MTALDSMGGLVPLPREGETPQQAALRILGVAADRPSFDNLIAGLSEALNVLASAVLAENWESARVAAAMVSTNARTAKLLAGRRA